MTTPISSHLKTRLSQPTEQSVSLVKEAAQKKDSLRFIKKFDGFLESKKASSPQSVPANTISFEPNLSDQNIKDRLEVAKEELHKRVAENLGDDKGWHEKADAIIEKGKDALTAVRDNNDKWLKENHMHQQVLEAIIIADGSRPSYLIKDGRVDRNSAVDKVWGNLLDSSQAKLTNAIACVGRINDGGLHIGTGFLIGPNLIMTNHHVLENIANIGSGNSWQIRDTVSISFGFEESSVAGRTRKLTRAVFYIASDFKNVADPKKLDLALIELDDADEGNKGFLKIYSPSTWATEGQTIYTIGYPAAPNNPIDHDVEARIFFKPHYGWKRLAPGRVLEAQDGQAWSVWHDATTLAGNSGSAILVVSAEEAAAAIHFGGRDTNPAANWGHILSHSDTLSTRDGQSSKSLQDILAGYGVKVS